MFAILKRIRVACVSGAIAIADRANCATSPGLAFSSTDLLFSSQ